MHFNKSYYKCKQCGIKKVDSISLEISKETMKQQTGSNNNINLTHLIHHRKILFPTDVDHKFPVDISYIKLQYFDF